MKIMIVGWWVSAIAIALAALFELGHILNPLISPLGFEYSLFWLLLDALTIFMVLAAIYMSVVAVAIIRNRAFPEKYLPHPRFLKSQDKRVIFTYAMSLILVAALFVTVPIASRAKISSAIDVVKSLRKSMEVPARAGEAGPPRTQ